MWMQMKIKSMNDNANASSKHQCTHKFNFKKGKQLWMLFWRPCDHVTMHVAISPCNSINTSVFHHLIMWAMWACHHMIVWPSWHVPMCPCHQWIISPSGTSPCDHPLVSWCDYVVFWPCGCLTLSLSRHIARCLSLSCTTLLCGHLIT